MSCHSHAHAHAPAQVITAWGAYISVHLIMLLAIYLLAPNDFVQMCATPISPPYLPCICPTSPLYLPYISLMTSSRCALPLNRSPSHTLAITRTLTLVLTLPLGR